MTFVSYAQNMEDVMLWRALKGVEEGFYIDVGANDPVEDSVTQAFYDRGWRGINIEPLPQMIEKFKKERSRDINLQMAAGSERGELLFFEFPETGLSTMDKETAERHEEESGFRKKEWKAPVRTLTEICQEHHSGPVHFLKIDVEGAEKQVLQGADFNSIRPWIVVVESTIPNSPVEEYEKWESMLLTAGYQYVYFDGLNRYYVACEHAEIESSFRVPPNIFDSFVFSCRGSSLFHQQGNYSDEKIRLLEAERKALYQELDDTKELFDGAIKGLHSTVSWRITWPLRKFKQIIKKQISLIKVVAQWPLSLQRRFFGKKDGFLWGKVLQPLVWNGGKLIDSQSRLRPICISLARNLGFYDTLKNNYSRILLSKHPSRVLPSLTSPNSMDPAEPVKDTSGLQLEIILASGKWNLGKRIDD